MTKATMTAMERMEAAVKLEPLDRIPCAPLMDVFFPSRYKGWPIARGIHNIREGFHAIGEVFDAVGGWDGMLVPGFSVPATPHVHSGVAVGETLSPGRELGEDEIPQFVETVAITHDDYDLILKLGLNRFQEKVKARFNPFPDDKIIKWTQRQMEQYRYELDFWKERGIRTLCGAITASPLHILSTARSLMEVTRDIYYIPDKLAALMCLGTPEEVEAYCKKVIDVVGDGGGFILSTGCTCPADCKIENLQAMVDTAKSYWPH